MSKITLIFAGIVVIFAVALFVPRSPKDKAYQLDWGQALKTLTEVEAEILTWSNNNGCFPDSLSVLGRIADGEAVMLFVPYRANQDISEENNRAILAVSMPPGSGRHEQTQIVYTELRRPKDEKLGRDFTSHGGQTFVSWVAFQQVLGGHRWIVDLKTGKNSTEQPESGVSVQKSDSK